MYRNDLVASYNYIKLLRDDLHSAEVKLNEAKRELHRVKVNDLVTPLLWRQAAFFILSIASFIIPFFICWRLLNTYMVTNVDILCGLVISTPFILNGFIFYFACGDVSGEIAKRRRDG